MEDKIIETTPRLEDFGSAGARRLIRAGRIPAVVYGKSGIQHVSLDAHDFGLALRKLGVGSEVTLKLGKRDAKCVIKEIQEDLVKSVVRHVDFKEL